MQLDRTACFDIDMQTVLAQFDIHIPNIQVKRVVMDSRQATQDTAFLCLEAVPERRAQYMQNAVTNGATLIIQDSPRAELHGYCDFVHARPVVSFMNLKHRLGEFCNACYDAPTTKLCNIAITGTNGKTSVTHIIAQLASLSGYDIGTLGTLGINYYPSQTQGDLIAESINTSVDVLSFHHYCAWFLRQGAKIVASEASSHGLAQNRLQGALVDIAVFTNLSQDHLDYHGDMASYAMAKRQLLKVDGVKQLVLNYDDPESKAWFEAKTQAQEVIYFSIDPKTQINDLNQRYCIAKDIQRHNNGINFSLCSSWGNHQVRLALVGDFNLANFVCAMATLLAAGYTFEQLIAHCDKISGVPGRMEMHHDQGGKALVVDYAHTPDALEKALIAARQHCSGKLWVVFGCGGDRDKDKRHKMGRIAESLADQLVLTQDNSRSENAEKIIADIMQGIGGTSGLHIELDRKQAITYAYTQMADNDLVLIAGKGHEQYMEVQDTLEFYDERLFVRNLLAEQTI